MIKLVNSVADLTALRDREELEIIMALAAADLLGATTVKLWRLVGYSDELRLHERALLADRRVTISDAPSNANDLPTLDSRRDLRLCYDRQTPLPASPSEKGRRGHIFPIMSARGVVGFLEICRATPLSDHRQRLVSGLLRIYQNHLKILDYSESDALTGLLNRRTFEAAFAHLTRMEATSRVGAVRFERIERRRPIDPDQPRWLAALDIDFFKGINDRFGHQCGDDVLVSMARLMRISFREGDRLFRYGGEEFVILLEPMAAQYVSGVLERFRALVEAHDFPRVGSVTISIGYTCVGAADDGTAAFRRADDALYAAKRQGRNQVICYEELGCGAVLSTHALLEADALVH
ncbi:GGDEF domain-containing protein [Methylocapsa sp. S129]|uniref:GGDEF domain-containing protein n=1 Tax=Methylocapsa sp. S129 TaxID=1641869 RepID=UPI00131A9C9C|nr:GGDEF domain-containing protein [Methylocapsa sp. S129]